MVKRKIFAEWLQLADEDFGFASTNLEDSQSTYFGLICFHFQQAAEKYLKAFIVANKLPFSKIHDLDTLRRLCQKKSNEFVQVTDECIFLSDFYIQTRYPVIWPVGITRNDAVKAQKAAGKIAGLVKNLLS